MVSNAAFYGERKNYDRYPGNAQSIMLANTVMAYPFYLLAMLFPQMIWLGLAVMLFGFFQLVGHGIILNIKGRTLYNPGLATALGLFVPIGIYYIMSVHGQGRVTGMGYVYGALAFAAAVFVILFLPIRAYMDRNSPYR